MCVDAFIRNSANHNTGVEVNVMSINFRSIVQDDYESVRQFLSEVGWEQRVSDRDQFKKLMDNSSRTVVADEQGRIVGFARALCDEVSNGYISMVAVAPDKREQGLGRELVQRLIGDDVDITWVLRAGRESGDFWRKIGFVHSEIAMEKLRA